MSDASDNEGEEEVTKKEKVGTKRKGKKEKKAGPKRPLSAYMYFCSDKRAETKAQNPTMTFSELGKKLGAMWQELDEASKKPYVKLNEKDKKRYDEEKANFPADEDDGGSKKKAKGTKGKKDKDAPKGATSAYMFFCADERKRLKEEDPSLDFKTIGKKMGENWKALDEDSKAKYIKLNEESKEKAAAAKAAYAKANPGAAKAKKAKKAKKGSDDEEEPADEDGDDDAGGDDE